MTYDYQKIKQEIKKINTTISSNISIFYEYEFDINTEHLVYNVNPTSNNLNMLFTNAGLADENMRKLVTGKYITILNTHETFSITVTMSSMNASVNFEPGSNSPYTIPPRTGITVATIENSTNWSIQLITKGTF